MEKNSKPNVCPGRNFTNKVSFFSRDENLNENPESFDTEKGLDMAGNSVNNSCPFISNNKSTISNSNINSINDECKNENNSDEEEISGGCPVMNKTKSDPINKHFEQYYEIPRFGSFDFLFVMRGMLDENEYLEKTKKLRMYPRHMKYTLLVQNQEKLKKIHEKEFPVVFFLYDDIKEKGNRLFRRKKFREAIEHYVYSYGLLKWIEFKDKKRQENFLKNPTLDAILDEDIEEKQVYLDNVQVEEDSFKACLVYLLMNLSYAYMELRHFSEAIDCLDECAEIAGDLVPDVYFRRSQARTYNKSSSKDDYEKASVDIEKAIKLKDEKMYIEHREILCSIINKNLLNVVEKTEFILSKAKKSYQRIKGKNLSIDEVLFTKKDKDAIVQYKILKELIIFIKM